MSYDVRMVGGPRDGVVIEFAQHPSKRIIWGAGGNGVAVRNAVYEVQPPTPPSVNPSIAVFAGYREKR